MTRLANIWHLTAVRTGGTTESSHQFGLVLLAQAAKELLEGSRKELFVHLFAEVDRAHYTMRRQATAAYADLCGIVHKVRIFKFARLRQSELAKEGGREAAKEAMAKAPYAGGGGGGGGPGRSQGGKAKALDGRDDRGSKQPRTGAGMSGGGGGGGGGGGRGGGGGGGGGGRGGGGFAQRVDPPTNFVRNDFSFAKDSLTALICRDSACGAMQAWDALGLPGKPCGWKALCKAGCTKPTCRKCREDNGGPPPPQWAVDKIKAACNSQTLQLLK